MAVLPDSSFVHTLHHGERNLEEEAEFVDQIKAKSSGQVPLFSPDDWFYEKALLEHYGEDWHPPYAGRGRRPLPRRVLLPDLKCVQVQKRRDDKGRLLEIRHSIVYGTLQAVEQVFESALRCKNINTVYVESRNGKFRKGNAKLIRRTLCHSKRSVFHDAQANFTAQVVNYTRTNDGLRITINPEAPKFEQKYKHRVQDMD